MTRQVDLKGLTRRGKPATTNLPVVRDRLVGRERDMAIARSLLRRDDIGLLTLTGAGGSGKTRLALALARSLLYDFDDGVYFVELAPLRDPGLVPLAVAQSVGLQDSGGRPPEVALRDF